MRRGKQCQNLCSLSLSSASRRFSETAHRRCGFRFAGEKTYLGLDLFDLSSPMSVKLVYFEKMQTTRGHTLSTVVDMMPVMPNYATKSLLMFPSSGDSSSIREICICRNLCGRRSSMLLRRKGQPKVLNLVMPNLFVCGGGMNIFWMGFWWGKFLVCGLRVANDVSAFARPSHFGNAGILS